MNKVEHLTSDVLATLIRDQERALKIPAAKATVSLEPTARQKREAAESKRSLFFRRFYAVYEDL